MGFQRFRSAHTELSDSLAERVCPSLRTILPHLHAVGYPQRPAVGAVIELTGIRRCLDFLQGAACNYGLTDLKRHAALLNYV